MGKSSEKTSDYTKTSLCAPIRDPQGAILGVFRCINKHQRTHAQECEVFCESDLSILDAVEQAMVPHLLVLTQEERRAWTVGRLTHEIKVPFSVIRGAAELLHREADDYDYQFSHDFTGDIMSWCDLARRLLHNVDFFRFRADPLPLRLQHIYLLRDVFGPARSQISPLLREKGFSSKKISHDGFAAIPRVWADQNQFQQVFFNLISNSVKYGYDDPNAFQVEVVTEATVNDYRIRFRDWGPGIAYGYEKVIFEEGVRGQTAELQNVSGDGLGLWVVSRIVEAHGGTVCVSNNNKPTEFLIELPKRITTRWIPE